MAQIQLDALDVSLLRVLDALLAERSVTRAGTRLGVTQSTVSHALSRLRILLNDDLFVRGPGGMKPTPRALQIGPRLRSSLLQLQLALACNEFVAAETRRHFTLMCLPYLNEMMMPDVIRRLRDAAPNAEVTLRPYGSSIKNALETGRVDLVIGSFAHWPDEFATEQLFDETMAWVVGDQNPVEAPLTLEDLSAMAHVVTELPPDVGSNPADVIFMDSGVGRFIGQDDSRILGNLLREKGLEQPRRIIVPDSRSALAIVACTAMAAAVPRRLALSHAKSHPVKLFSPPYASPCMKVSMMWHRELGADAALIWLRDMVRAVAAKLDDADRQA